MCNSAPQLLYYTYIPVLVLILILGFLVLLSNKKNLSNRLFFLLSLCTSFWIFLNMMTWRSVNPDMVIIFDKLSIVGIIVPAVFLYFSYIFSDEKKISKKKIILIFLPLVPFILLAGTNLNIESIDSSTPDCESVVGPLYYLMPLIFFSYCLWAGIVLFKKFKMGNEQVKKQIKMISIGFMLFIAWGTITNVVAPLIGFDSVSFFGPIGALIFMCFVAYAIVKYQLLSIKVIAAQALMVALVILIGSQFFFTSIDDVINIVLISITVLVSVIFGIWLIDSVKLEVQRKEELQEMADRLAVANDELRKLDNAKTEFISIASHQLRTPITAIKGFTSLIMEGSYGEVSKNVRSAVERIFVSSERLVNLIEDLLNVSRIESGRLSFTFEKASVSKLLEELYENFLIVAKNKKFYLDLKLPKKSIPEINMDYSKIRELVSNFIDNALKYTERGGVTISAEVRKEGVVIDENGFVIPDKKSEYGKVVRIIISDTGIGIPKEEIPYLFRKFSRGKDVSRLHATGTGLGLYVGKAIAEAHHGQTWVESDGAGKGSRFIIEIPLDTKL